MFKLALIGSLGEPRLGNRRHTLAIRDEKEKTLCDLDDLRVISVPVRSHSYVAPVSAPRTSRTSHPSPLIPTVLDETSD